MKKLLLMFALVSMFLFGCSDADDTAQTEEPKQEEKTEDVKEEVQKEDPKEETQKEEPKEDVSKEFKNALESAKTYSDMMYMSKKGIYEQLISEHGDKFPVEAAQYAVDNLDVDYKENALKSAQDYYETMNMSKEAVYDQLVSEYGDGFTEEEAQYAVDNLE